MSTREWGWLGHQMLIMITSGETGGFVEYKQEYNNTGVSVTGYQINHDLFF